MATILNAKDIAARFDTDTRTLRKFLRSDDSGVDAVGKGGRYNFTAAEVRGMKSKFDRWDAARKAPAAPAGEVEEVEVDPAD